MADTAVVSAPAPAAPAPGAAPETGKPAEPVKATEGAKLAGTKERVFLINGKEWPESQLAQRIQKAEGLEKRVQDADRYEKAFQNFAAKVDDPQQFIELLGSKEFKYDEDKQSAMLTAMLNTKKPKLVAAVKQWLFENEIEPSSLTEEQRRLRELEKENQKFKTEAQKKEEAEKSAKLAAESKAIYQEYIKKISEGLKANNLPLHEFVVKMALNYAKVQRVNANQPFDISGAMKYTKDFLNSINADVEKWDDATILNAYSENALKKINQAYINRLKKSAKLTEEPAKPGAEQHPFKRKTKQEATSKENKDFWKNAGRGVFPS